MQLTQYITGNQLLSSHVQFQSAISNGGSYRRLFGSSSLNIDLMSQRESFTSQFASSLYTIASGLEIEERNGHYYTSNSQSRSPSPIKISLATIDTALDSRLWTRLPETRTSYRSLQIDRKKQCLVDVLGIYSNLTNAQQASGIPIHATQSHSNVSQ